MFKILKVKPSNEKFTDAVMAMNLSTTAHSYSQTLCSGVLHQMEDISHAYLIYLERKVIGWGAIIGNEANIFVHRKYRNRGAGSMMVSRLTKEHPHILFCPWNRRVQGFFNKRKATYTKTYLW